MWHCGAGKHPGTPRFFRYPEVFAVSLEQWHPGAEGVALSEISSVLLNNKCMSLLRGRVFRAAAPLG